VPRHPYPLGPSWSRPVCLLVDIGAESVLGVPRVVSPSAPVCADESERERVPRPLTWLVRVYLDLCCLTASALRYRLLTDSTCICIGVDLHKPDYIKQLVAGALGGYCGRFRYVEMDAGSLTLDGVRRLVETEARQPLTALAGVHASTDCTTLSFAKRKKGRHHRAMGPPNSYTIRQLESMDTAHVDQLVAPVSEKAISDDGVRCRILEMLCELVRAYPRIVITAENPRALFRFMPDVRRVAAMPGWQLVSLDYCAVAVPGCDEDTPQKPSDLLLYGAPGPVAGPVCARTVCPFVLPGTTLHRKVVCGSSSLDARQMVLRCVIRRSMIPLGVFRWVDEVCGLASEEPLAEVVARSTIRVEQGQAVEILTEALDSAALMEKHGTTADDVDVVAPEESLPVGETRGGVGRDWAPQSDCGDGGPGDPGRGYTQGELDKLLVGELPEPKVPAGRCRMDLAVKALLSLPTHVRLWLGHEGLTSATLRSGTFDGTLPAMAELATAVAWPGHPNRLEAIAAGVSLQIGDGSFVRSPTLGIADDWSSGDQYFYGLWDDVSALRLVYAAVHRLITYVAGSAGSPYLIYDPEPKMTKPTDWRKGMLHESQHVECWAKLTTINNWALHMLRGGFYAVPHTAVPTSRRRNAPTLRPESDLFDEEQTEFVRKKMRTEIAAGVQNVVHDRPFVLHGVHLVPKPDGSDEKWRIVHDMSSFRRYFDKIPFKAETLKSFPEAFKPGLWYWRTDLQAAYHGIEVQSWMRTLFGIEFEGMYMESAAAPFGFRLSAYWCHRLAKIALGHLRAKGHYGVFFLDDNLWAATSFAEAVLMQIEVLTLYESLGFRFNRKSHMLPTRQIEYLGALAHTAAAVPTWHMPDRKIQRYKAEAQGLADGTAEKPVRKVAKVIGQMISIAIAVPLVRVLSHELYAVLYSNRELDWQNSKVALSAEARAELDFYFKYVSGLNDTGFPIWASEAVTDLKQLAPHYTVAVDASFVGVGWQVNPAHVWPAPMPARSPLFDDGPPPVLSDPPLDGAGSTSYEAHIPFHPKESQMPQAMREMLGLALCVRSLASMPCMRGRRVRAYVDASATMFCYRNGGGRSKAMCRILRFLHMQLLCAGIVLVDVVWTPGEQMVLNGTDALSRPRPNTIRDRGEWRMQHMVYQAICQWAGFVPFHDLFASRVNSKCDAYFSSGADAGRTGEPNAFANSWRGLDAWAFPPQHLITLTVRFAILCKCRILLVVPTFRMQLWWNEVERAAQDVWHLGRRPDLFERLCAVDGRSVWQPVARPFAEFSVFYIDARPPSPLCTE
jgi:hypothetical protein